MRSISSRQNPVIAMYRAAARGDADDRMLLDGAHLLSEAIDAGLGIEHVLVAAEAAANPTIVPLLERLHANHTTVDTGAATVMAAASPVRSASPVVALARRPSPASGLFSVASAFVIVACDVQDPGNLGAMARVAEAAGASGFVAAGHGADPFGWKALRGSMGSLLRLPVECCESAETALRAAKQAVGCRVVATVPRGGRSIFEASLGGAIALFIGGEGAGLPARVQDEADERLTIPMQAPVESLNAAVTTALIAYEVRRQRS